MSRLVKLAALPCVVAAVLIIIAALIAVSGTQSGATARPAESGAALTTVASLVEPPAR